MAKLPEKEYGENEFSCREIYSMNDFDEYVDENNVDEILEKAAEEIKTDIDDQDKDSIIGIQAFSFELVIIEDIYYQHISNNIYLLELWMIKVGILKVKGLYLLLSFVLFFLCCLVCFFVCCLVVSFWVWNG